MSFLGSNSLTQLLKDSGVISPFDEEKIKNGAYELSLGSQVFQTDSKPRVVTNLIKNEKIYIEPGQFALLLTEEYVKIPKDRIAFISIKAGVKFKGLVNVSGFHVDPGFEGNLLFSVYNAGPSTIVLSQGTEYFPIWFAELNETQPYKGVHKAQSKIPDAPVEALSQGDLASPSALLNKIKENYSILETKINTADEAQKNRIGLLERDQKAIDYLVKTALGVVLVIILKFVLDWAIFNTGLTKGVEIKGKEIGVDSTINKLLLEKRKLMLEIDSLTKVQEQSKKKVK
jgi:dCTP deaminase